VKPRLLVIPAAGTGSRLGDSRPKVLVPVAGRPMLDWLLDLQGAVDHAVVVVNPAALEQVRRHVRERTDMDFAIQPRPTGMLDAILAATDAVRRHNPREVWITWCDQIAVHPRTVARLAALTEARRDAALIMPTVWRADPYIHLRRDSEGRIRQVLHRREGDEMPDVGESDMGLFALTAATFADLLPAYARDVEIGQATSERNFLPFIPWVAARRPVVTWPCEDPMEAVGVNTPEDRQQVERYFAARED
jgi:bifunctional UDP-N-acetylglucosamine pyrophosphorylase/glucosamine-1-phosphate N-acetyltransferase